MAYPVASLACRTRRGPDRDLKGMNGPLAGTPLDTIAHIVQTSLAPVFLLSGIATLLSTLTTRLGRVSDLMQRVSTLLEVAERESDKAALLRGSVNRLQQRSTVLILALVSGTVAGAATCSAILTLFVGALSDRGTAAVLFAFFGAAIVCTTGALVALLVETVLTWQELRVEATVMRTKHIYGVTDL